MIATSTRRHSPRPSVRQPREEGKVNHFVECGTHGGFHIQSSALSGSMYLMQIHVVLGFR